MPSLLIQNALLVNEGAISETDIYIENGRIHTLGRGLAKVADHKMDLGGRHHVFPGVIDDQVHFREPGLTHKADLRTESLAAIAGGTTSYMEMPNTKPPAFTQELLAQKYARAAEVSAANYSFFMGVSNDNYDELMRTDPRTVCGLKVFMGSSTGNLLVDDPAVLERLFANAPTLVASHCEHEPTIRRNTETFRERFGEAVPITEHPNLRSTQACWLSSSQAVALAQKHGARLHILHISTAQETELFRNDIPLSQKRITAEACIHHLWFSEADYAAMGSLIKWNPAVKTAEDREGIWAALLDGRIDVVATDHAPHTLAEKQNPNYFECPSGGPLVQHSLVAMLQFAHQGKITLETVAQKMAHNVATLFQIEDRGFVREGCWADLAIVDLNAPWTVTPESLRYKCGWSPFVGQTFQAQVTHTVLNGEIAYADGQVNTSVRGQRLLFSR